AFSAGLPLTTSLTTLVPSSVLSYWMPSQPWFFASAMCFRHSSFEAVQPLWLATYAAFLAFFSQSGPPASAALARANMARGATRIREWRMGGLLLPLFASRDVR